MMWDQIPSRLWTGFRWPQWDQLLFLLRAGVVVVVVRREGLGIKEKTGRVE